MAKKKKKSGDKPTATNKSDSPVFRDPRIENALKYKDSNTHVDILTLGWYLKNADTFSQAITTLKNHENGSPINAKLAQAIIPLLLHCLCKNIAVAAVPSSSRSKVRKGNHGITEFVKQLCSDSFTVAPPENSAQLENLTGALYRTKSIGKQQGQSKKQRSPDEHLQTLKANQEQVQGKSILLLDDVVTTGGTMFACRQKLKEAGATRVVCLALTHAYGDVYYEAPSPAEQALVHSLVQMQNGNIPDMLLDNWSHFDQRYFGDFVPHSIPAKIDIKLVIFDFDFTLFDTTVIKELKDNHTLSGDAQNEAISQATKNKHSRIPVYRGIEAMFCGLQRKGIKIAIVTNGVDGRCNSILYYHSSINYKRDLATPIIGYYQAPEKRKKRLVKPAPDMIALALKNTETSPENALVIGDSPRDILAGRRAGCLTAGAYWGLRNTGEKAFLSRSYPNYELHNPGEVLTLTGTPLSQSGAEAGQQQLAQRVAASQAAWRENSPPTRMFLYEPFSGAITVAEATPVREPVPPPAAPLKQGSMTDLFSSPKDAKTKPSLSGVQSTLSQLDLDAEQDSESDSLSSHSVSTPIVRYK